MIKNGRPKSLTLALAYLVIEECAAEGLTVLLDFQFDESTGFRRFLFSVEGLLNPFNLWAN
jgi:hypothetical protein